MPPNLVCSGKVRVACHLDAIWTLLLDGVEYPTLYDSNIARVRSLERTAEDKGVKRRLTTIINPKQVILHTVEITPPVPKEQLPRPVSAPGLDPDNPISPEDLATIFRKLDVNQSGVIEKKNIIALLETDEETKAFCKASPALEMLTNTATWRAAFDCIDSIQTFKGRKDGIISWPEFRAFFIPTNPLSREPLLGMWRRWARWNRKWNHARGQSRLQ